MRDKVLLLGFDVICTGRIHDKRQLHFTVAVEVIQSTLWLLQLIYIMHNLIF